MSSELRFFWESAGGTTPNNWRFVKFEDLLRTPKSISVGVMYPGEDTDGGTPLIRVADIKNGRIADHPTYKICSEVNDEYRRTILSGDEILITLVGNPGECALVNSKNKGWNVARAIAAAKLADPRINNWIKYVFDSAPAKHIIASRLNTTVQKTLNLKDIRQLPIPLPPEEDRMAITAFLDQVNDKIDILGKINQTLEAMAQAIFKSWFVDFDPVRAKAEVIKQGGSASDATLAAMQVISGKTAEQIQAFAQTHPDDYQQLHTTASLFPSAFQNSELGEIPEGWESHNADSLIDFNPKEPLKKATPSPYVDMASLSTNGSWVAPPDNREYGSGMRFRNFDTLLARITPCLENGKTAFIQSLPDGEIAWGSTEFIVMRSKAGIPKSFSYLLARDDTFREHAIKSMTGTSGRQRVPVESLLQFKINAPKVDSKLWRSLGLFIESAFTLIHANSLESLNLEKMRDALLPKLLSGEIDVSQLTLEQ